DAVLGCNRIDNRHQVFGAGDDLVVNLFAGFAAVRVDAVQQADAHCDGAHIEMLRGEHLDGFHNVAAVENLHAGPPYTLCIASKTSCRVRVTCMPIFSAKASNRARTAAWSVLQAERLTSIIMQNISCIMLDRKSTRLNSSHVSISYAV